MVYLISVRGPGPRSLLLLDGVYFSPNMMLGRLVNLSPAPMFFPGNLSKTALVQPPSSRALNGSAGELSPTTWEVRVRFTGCERKGI